MKAKKYWILLVIGICIFVALPFLGKFTFNYIEKRDNAKIDMLLKKLNEGMPFVEVKQILGEPWTTFTDQNDVKRYGTAKNSNIITECNLHTFLVGYVDIVPPLRYILVYEDKQNHTARLVTTKETRRAQMTSKNNN